MICKKCGNKNDFLVMITDFKPLELWTFKDGLLTRYTKKDEEAGYLDVKIKCTKCGADTKEIDKEGFDFVKYHERPLVILSDEDWAEREKNFKKAPSIDELEVEEEEEENTVDSETEENKSGENTSSESEQKENKENQ